MSAMEKLKRFRRSRKKYWITAALLAVFAALMLYGRNSGLHRSKLVYSQSLDEVAAEVNGAELTFREVAFYVAVEEAQVEKQAYEYDPENPKKYWNTHVNGLYIRVAARNAAIQMAIHDEVFYQLAMNEGVALSAEEEENVLFMYEEYLSDFTADGKMERLGVSPDDIYESMCKMAYAQKYQSIYAQLSDAAYEEYNFGEARYEELLKEQNYVIHKDVWGRVDFGNVTISREEE